MYTMIIMKKNGNYSEFTSSSLKKLQELAKEHINELAEKHPNYTIVLPTMTYDRKNPANPRKRTDAPAHYVKFHTTQANRFHLTTGMKSVLNDQYLKVAYFIMNDEYDYISIRYTPKQG